MRQVRKRGVFEIHKTNYVVLTTELGEETARWAQSAKGKLCGRRHAVKKVCEKRKLDGRGGIIPTAERLRGKNYAPEKCAAEIRQAGKRGITLSESLRHHPQHMVYGNAAIVILRRFFHYYNIIVRLSGFFRSRPRKPRNTGVPACQVRLFYIASAGLDKYFVRWYNICAKEQMFVSTRGVYPNHRPVSPGGYFNRKTEQMFD